MVNVVLSSDNVTVLGGPSRLEVDLNIGANGTRGGLFFLGNGNPNNLNPSQDFPTSPQIFDLFIDSDPSSDQYLQSYQLINQDGENVWVPAFKLTQDVYSVNSVLEFSNGEASIDINLTALGLETIPFDTLTNSFAYFNVQATLGGSDLESQLSPAPIAFSVDVSDAYFDNSGSFDPGEFPLFLPVSFRAVEFVGSSWSNVDDKKIAAYITISLANPNEIFQIVANNVGGES